jgi:hypothetical protein
MFNVAVLSPSSGKCEFRYAQSLANLGVYFCSTEIEEGVNIQGIQFVGQQSFSTSCNREMLIDWAITKNFTHVLFIDDDMEFEKDILHDLARRKLDFVVCDYPRKKIPQSMIAIGMDGKEMKMSEGIEEARQVGFGMALIDMKVIKSVNKPRFPLPFNSQTGEYGSEDYWFCKKAIDNGYKIFVDHDASKKVGHIGSYTFRRVYA